MKEKRGEYEGEGVDLIYIKKRKRASKKRLFEYRKRTEANLLIYVNNKENVGRA